MQDASRRSVRGTPAAGAWYRIAGARRRCFDTPREFRTTRGCALVRYAARVVWRSLDVSPSNRGTMDMRCRDLLLCDVATWPEYAVAPASHPEPPMPAHERCTGGAETLASHSMSAGRTLRNDPLFTQCFVSWRTTMNRKPYLCIAAVGLATVLGGCGQSADTSKSAASSPTATTPSRTSASASGSMAAADASQTSSSQRLATDQETAASASRSAAGNPPQNAPAAGSGGAPALGDATISAEVEAAIKAEPALESQPITIETNGATVTLTGSVAKVDLRSKAEQVAMSTPGVKNVVNHLAVEPS